jgi:hypothetical protein
VERRGEAHRHFPDLDEALRDGALSAPSEWRIHFHVPLFASAYESFGSTQDYVRRVLELVVQSRITSHLEIETYTWSVLPSRLKVDLDESIAREYDWVLGALDRISARAH